MRQLSFRNFRRAGGARAITESWRDFLLAIVRLHALLYVCHHINSVRFLRQYQEGTFPLQITF